VTDGSGGRHRAADQDDVSTRLIPKITVPDEATSVLPLVTVTEQKPATTPVTVPGADAEPRMVPLPPISTRMPPRPDAARVEPPVVTPPDPAATAIIPKVPSATPTTSPTTEPKNAPTPDGPPADDAPDAKRRFGVRVVPLRPVRTEEGYKSVYQELTQKSRFSTLRAISRGTGEVLITFGLIVLLFAAYEVWGKAAIVNSHQNDLDKQLNQEWAGDNPTIGPSSPSGQPTDGQVFAKLNIPRMKKQWAVVEGVSVADIRYAPGHYPDTAMPGEVGNFSMAGHRTPAIFWDLDKLQPGDAIVVQTAKTWFIYKVTGHEIVKPTAVQVVAPVPDQPGSTPTAALLTLTTCNPKLNNYQRYVVHAQLDHSSPVSAGNPPELKD
jgi:sortase A